MARGSLGHLRCSPPPPMAGAGGPAVPKTLGSQPVAGAGARAALSGRQTPSPHPASGRGIGAQPLHLAERKDRTPTRDTPLPGGAQPKPAQGAPQAPSPGNPSAPPPQPQGAATLTHSPGPWPASGRRAHRLPQRFRGWAEPGSSLRPDPAPTGPPRSPPVPSSRPQFLPGPAGAQRVPVGQGVPGVQEQSGLR